jgi:hypothetical protein
MFQTELKENLKVKPLPKIKKLKIQFREYERMMTEPIPQTAEFMPKPKTSEVESPVCQKKYIFSNQLSTSLKTEYPDKLLFELNSRRLKLNQTMQNFTR